MMRTCLVVGVALLAFTGCESSTGASDDKYEQTWSKSYGETTCSEWISDMSQHEMWVAAADMVTHARDTDDENAAMPEDSMVDDFRDGITNACVEPTMTIAEVGALLYLTEQVRFKP
ncbi:MAG: hypothetical protein ACXVXP_11555 [Mycobacteriaceae bacterium]